MATDPDELECDDGPTLTHDEWEFVARVTKDGDDG
jgi:hypothetical protein